MRRALLLLALVAACAPAVRHRRPIDRSIRAIDFTNRPYYVRDVGDVNVSRGRGTIGATTLVLDPPEIADLDHDRSEDALVTGTLTRPGADPAKTITIYGVRGGSLRVLGTIDGRYIEKVWLQGRSILTQWTGDGRIFAYGWEDGRLQQRLDEDDEEP